MQKLNMDAGCYQTGFFITQLNMDIEKLDKYKEMAVQYVTLSRFTVEFMNKLTYMNFDKDMLSKIKANVDLFFKPYEVAVENISTFLHEYVHFLQDISTLTGITTINLCSVKIQAALNAISGNEASDKNGIHLPLKDCNSNIIEACSNYYSIYRGDGSYLPFKKLHHYNSMEMSSDDCFAILSSEDPEMYPENTMKSIHEIKIVFNDGEDKYSLGSYIISESMAYLFESTVFNAEKRENQYPYSICEMIVDKECPKLYDNKYLILAICELSLMHEHSGEMFYNIIKEIKEKELIFKNVSEFEKYFLPKTRHLLGGLESKYEHSIESDIDFLYPNIQQFGAINQQIKSMISAGIQLRKSGLFISKAAENNNKDCEINIWFEKCGIPLIIDNDYNTFSSQSFDNMATFIFCPKALDKLLFEHEKKCFLYNVCKTQKVVQNNFDVEICSQKSWIQTNNNQLCPFAAYLYHYSIDGNRIIKS